MIISFLFFVFVVIAALAALEFRRSRNIFRAQARMAREVQAHYLIQAHLERAARDNDSMRLSLWIMGVCITALVVRFFF